MTLRFEAWTLPWSGTFERVVADVPVVEGTGSGAVRFNDTGGESTITIPSGFPRLDEVISTTVGTITRVYDGTTIIQEFLNERVTRTVGEQAGATIRGGDLKQAFDRAVVYPFDYPASPTVFANHVWGGRNIVSNPGFEENEDTPEIYDVYNDATGGTFTLTVDSGTSETTAGIAYNATAAAVESALQLLANVTDVLVSGSGTASDPWRVEFVNPSVPTSMTGNGAGLTGATEGLVLTLVQNGTNEIPADWTRSQLADASSDPALHGTYAAFRLTSGAEPVRTGTTALFINPSSVYAGAQQIVAVEPGGLYQASIWIRTNAASQTFRLVIRDRYEGWIAQVEVTPTVDTWTELAIADIQIPSDIDEIIFRVATVTPTPAGLIYIDDATLMEGSAAATVGTIVTELMDDATSDHSGDTRGTILDWVDYSGFSATLDSAGNAWDDTLSFVAFRGATYGQTFDALTRLGYEWELTPKTTPSGGLTHNLEWYNTGALGTDHTTAVTPAVNIGQSTVGGPVISRIPAYTAVIVEGTDGIYVEDTDATALTNFGRFEKYRGNNRLSSTVSVTAEADELLTLESTNRKAVQITVVESRDHPRPLIAYKPGDTLYFQLPPSLPREARRVQSISWQNLTPTRYQITGSQIFDGETGVFEALRRELREFTPLEQPFRRAFVSTTQTAGGGSGGPSVLAYSYPGSVSVGRYQIPLTAGLLGNMHVRAKNAPTGANLLAEFRLNGTSLGSMTITAGSNWSGISTPSTALVADGDYLEVAVTQEGSTLPGSNLVFVIEHTPS